MDFSRLPKYPDGDSGPEPANRPGQFSPIDGLVETAIDVFLAHPDADDKAIHAALIKEGITPREAWRLLQFVPIAYVHVVLERSFCRFQPGYVAWNSKTGEKVHHLLRDEPLYRAGVRSARRWLARGANDNQIRLVYGRSAEWNALQKALAANPRTRGVEFCEPALVEFTEDG